MSITIPKPQRRKRSVEQRLEATRDQQARLKRELRRKERSEDLAALAHIGSTVVAAFSQEPAPAVKALLSTAKVTASDGAAFIRAYNRLEKRIGGRRPENAVAAKR